MKKVSQFLLWRGLLAAMMAVTLAACGSESETVASAPAPLVMVADAGRRDVPLYLEMVGTTMGAQDVPIRARVEGFLDSVDFQEGTFVEKGSLLYTIDPQPFQAKLVEAQSQLAGAVTTHTRTVADLERIRPLAEIKAVSEQDLDSSVAQEAAARATVRAAEAGVELAEITLSYTRIMAPIDGLIGLTMARPGEFVGREPNPVVLNTLSDIDPIRVRFSISEREYLILARTYLDTKTQRGEPGGRGDENKADLVLLLADGSEHPEKGRPVGSAQSIDSSTGTYSVDAVFPNPNKILLPGQFARVRAKYEELKDAVVIPRQAVSELQGLFRVYVVNSGKEVEVKEVKLGPVTGNDVVIESGLDGGESIIVEGLQKVRPGMQVTPRPFDAASPDLAGQG